MKFENKNNMVSFKVVLSDKERKDFKNKMRREAVKQQVYLANLIRKDLYGSDDKSGGNYEI